MDSITKDDFEYYNQEISKIKDSLDFEYIYKDCKDYILIISHDCKLTNYILSCFLNTNDKFKINCDESGLIDNSTLTKIEKKYVPRLTQDDNDESKIIINEFIDIMGDNIDFQYNQKVFFIKRSDLNIELSPDDENEQIKVCMRNMFLWYILFVNNNTYDDISPYLRKNIQPTTTRQTLTDQDKKNLMNMGGGKRLTKKRKGNKSMKRIKRVRGSKKRSHKKKNLK